MSLTLCGCEQLAWNTQPLATVPTHRIDFSANLPLPAPPEVKPPPEPPQPKRRTVALGQSVRGKPLVLHVLGEGEEPVFIFAGIHGDEPTSTDLARSLLAYLEAHPQLWGDRCVAVLPAANPDGLAKRTRVNARGVDLNRNFPAKNFRASKRHGPKPASEPETRAIIAAMEMLQPGRIVSIHSCRRGRHCNNYDGPAQAIARAMHFKNGYRPLGVWHNATPGSFGSWAGIDQQIPTITLELPRDLSGPQCWEDNREALLAVIEFDAKEHAK